MTNQTKLVLGEIPISFITKKELFNKIIPDKKLIKKKRVIYYANIQQIGMFFSDEKFKKALLNADLIYPDGYGAVIAGMLSGCKTNGRMTGVDFSDALLRKLERQRVSIFLLGSKTKYLSRVVSKLKGRYPNIRLLGGECGYFNSRHTSSSVIKRINLARPDILIVGMGSPTQEYWVDQYKSKLQVKTIWCVGGLLEYWADARPVCPRWIASLGLEWMYRILFEDRKKLLRYWHSSRLALAALIRFRLRER